MNPSAARILGEGLLKGAFDVFDAMLSLSCKFETEAAAAATEEDLAEALTACPVAMQARIQNGLGAVALLFAAGDGARLAALVQETPYEGGESLSPGDKEVLRDVADSALGGGVTNLMERFGRAVEQLEAVSVSDAGAAGAGELAALMGGEAVLVPFEFQASPQWSGTGYVVYTAAMESMVPAKLLAGGGRAEDLAKEAALTPAEIGDILSGFTPDADEPVPGAPASGGAARPAVIPENLDMVLDIRLVATARLGRVEMPLGEIMALGPGSIIEVGQMVDEPVELLINDKLVARGDVVVVDERFGLRITEIVSARERIESLR
jgi:flagellar motor switch protein FliN/FliY